MKIKYSYINNLSDIIEFLKDIHLLKLYNSLGNNRIKVTSNLIHKTNYIPIKEQFIFNLDNYITFIKDKLCLNQQQIKYLISLTLNNKYNKILYHNKYYYSDINYYHKQFINMFMFEYKKNILFLKNYISIKERSFDEFISFINNKKRSYCYFEKINISNMNFYLSIIESLEEIN